MFYNYSFYLFSALFAKSKLYSNKDTQRLPNVKRYIFL